MRIAHLIMAYKDPSQLERLIKRLEHPSFDLYIHLDLKSDIEEFEYIKTNNVFFIKNRILCNWGGFSFVRAIVSAMKEILMKKEKYELINLLSAQDYPIKPIDHIYHFYRNNVGKSFISYDDSINSNWWQHAVTRYELFHFTDVRIKGRYLVQAILNRCMPKRKFPISCQLYGSATSTWWTLTSTCAQYIVDYLESNPKLLNFMKFTWAADEFLFTTIIMNSSFKNDVINNNLRYIEWEEGKPNPRIFEMKDLDSLRRSQQLFARKFDLSVDRLILDELDKLIETI